MDKQTKESSRNRLIIIIISLLVLALLAGWLIGKSGSGNTSNSIPSSSNPTESDLAAGNEVSSIVSYVLPDGWTEDTCPKSKNIIYVSPNGTDLNCSENPSSPIKIYTDPQNTTDCQQLNNVGDVKKHVCISLYIDGHKSLKASTEYPKSASYKEDTTISDYYIDTGKGVVKVEYTYISENNYQVGFDRLATSVSVK